MQSVHTEVGMLHGSYSAHPFILSLTLHEHIKGFAPPHTHTLLLHNP